MKLTNAAAIASWWLPLRPVPQRGNHEAPV